MASVNGVGRLKNTALYEALGNGADTGVANTFHVTANALKGQGSHARDMFENVSSVVKPIATLESPFIDALKSIVPVRKPQPQTWIEQAGEIVLDPSGDDQRTLVDPSGDDIILLLNGNKVTLDPSGDDYTRHVDPSGDDIRFSEGALKR